jgi:hypothetical protein
MVTPTAVIRDFSFHGDEDSYGGVAALRGGVE